MVSSQKIKPEKKMFCYFLWHYNDAEKMLSRLFDEMFFPKRLGISK